MAMSDFRRNKLIFVFKTFDTNGSGNIDKKDFELVAEKACQRRGLSTSEGKGAQIVQNIMDIWESLRAADKDGDGEIDADEWCHMWDDYAKGNATWQNKYMEVIFALHDISGDGNIGLDEFTAVNVRGDISAADCAEAFRKLSKGGSVEIDKEMFAALWKEFFTSDDKEAAGNYLFGKLSF